MKENNNKIENFTVETVEAQFIIKAFSLILMK